MPVLDIKQDLIGTNGFPSSVWRIFTNDTIEVVTTTGYLNEIVFNENLYFTSVDIAFVTTSDAGTAYMQLVVTTGNVSLKSYSVDSVTLVGTEDQIIATEISPSTWLLSLPQDIATTSDVEFKSLKLNNLNASAYSTIVGTDTSGNLYSITNTASTPRYISNSGVGNAPSWSTIDMANGVSGILSVANGGTNSSTALTNGKVIVSSGGKIVEVPANSSMGGFRLTNLADPVDSQDAATKNYVDIVASGPISLQGNWDASTNTPTLTAGSGTLNFGYYVSVAGTQTLPSGTSTVYTIGDLIYYGANNIWNKIDQGLRVISINGASGVMTLAGTSNQVGVVTSGTTITLTTPQNINSTANVTFNSATLGGLNASTALIANGDKLLASSVTTSTELGYVSGVTSSIQTQLNAKGTVSSVAMTVPSFLSVSGSPITGSGTLAVSLSGTALPLANGGTGSDLSATGGTGRVLKQVSSGGNVTVAQLAASELSNGTTGSGSIVLSNSPTISNIIFATGTGIETQTSAGNTVLLQAYDVDGASYKTFGTLTANNTPSYALSQPSGGLLTWDGGAIGATTQANAQFYSPVNVQTGTTYTLAASDCGKIITLNNASAVTLTLPQQSSVTTSVGFWCHVINIGSGTVTIVKEGSELLIGNNSLITNAQAIIERTATTSWFVSYGTATINAVGMAQINISITTSNTKDLWCPQASATFLGIRFRAFSVGTAGTFKLQLNGSDITGLTGLVPSTSQTYSYASSSTSLLAGDVITIVADGTLATIADLNITPIYTVTY